ncbi:dihydrofolate reductase [Candidatus Peregrinibacteria bacterium]|nr:dihydrofolate reductase [Candidatus Peregrinibacteria bacterium]
MSKNVYLIAAADRKNGIGIKGKIPWDLKEDIQHFRKVTEKTENHAKINLVIMGRTTWESIPETFRPLPGRRNVVLTKNKDFKAEGAYVCHSLEEAFQKADDAIESVFIIGGAKVYAQAIKNSKMKGIYLTRINKEFKCDASFPNIPKSFKKITRLGGGDENGVPFEFLLYEK